MEGTVILNAIIEKGGLIGICAKMYIHDSSLTDQFIMECYEQCHVPEVKSFYGDELVIKMKDYISNLPGRQKCVMSNL